MSPWPWPLTTTAWRLGSMIRHAECHTQFKSRGAVTRSPLPGFVKVADSKPFRMELPLGTSRRAPSAQMMLREILSLSACGESRGQGSHSDTTLVPWQWERRSDGDKRICGWPAAS